MDKVQKIREEIEKLKLCTMDEHMKFYSDAAEAEYNALCNIGHFIDYMQEEPVEQVKEDTMTIRKEWFEHCRKSWYNEGYIDGTHNRDRQFKEPVIEVLLCAADSNSYKYIESVRGAAMQAFEDGAQWQKEQFEKGRLKHCDELTDEQAQIESDFVDKHLKENSRTPTFIDAIEYGMRLHKEQMMKDAVEAKVYNKAYPTEFEIETNTFMQKLKHGDNVKLIIINEE